MSRGKLRGALELWWFLSFQVAPVSKFSENSGLGISLEATMGHHFIRSVLPEGPVGHSGKLFSGDELLEVRISDFLFFYRYKMEKNAGELMVTIN